MRSLISSFLWSAFIVLAITASANADYKLIDLGTLGGSYSCAYSINDSGQIVGSSSIRSSSSEYATLFDSTGGGANTNIAPIVSGSRHTGVANSINNNGQIVGTASTRAYIFDSTGRGAGTNLGTLAGFNYSEAKAINDNGWIVGDVGIGLQPSVTVQAARFNPPPKIKLAGGYSIAYAVNNNNKIVGGGEHAAILDSTGGGANIDLGGLAGYSSSMAYSINNFDQIVGGSYNYISDSYSAVLFDSTGGGANINLGAFEGFYNQSIARSINDRGQIVGCAFGWSHFPSHAVLFDTTGHGDNIDLNTLVEPSSWILNIAYGINNDGWIVGSMYNYSNDETHAFLLTPEPASAAIFMIGAVLVAAQRKKR